MDPATISALIGFASTMLSNKSKEEQARLQGLGDINPLPVDNSMNQIQLPQIGGGVAQRLLGGIR